MKTWVLLSFRKNVKNLEKNYCRSGTIDYHLRVGRFERFERFDFLLVG